MTGLDTNVLVRYLTQDDPVQGKAAVAAITKATQDSARCFVSAVVLCELVWVLEGAYEYAKPDILRTLDMILATRQFDVDDKDLVRTALESYREGRADFADYLLGALHRRAGCGETLTFDRRLARTPGFRLL